MSREATRSGRASWPWQVEGTFTRETRDALGKVRIRLLLFVLVLRRLGSVDEGKLTWDEPVTRVFPSFRLGNEAITRQVLMRHLVCACTGMPRKDLEWILNTHLTLPPHRRSANWRQPHPRAASARIPE